MSVLITRTGFASETFAGTFQPFDAIEALDPEPPAALEIAAGFDVDSLVEGGSCFFPAALLI